MLQKPKLRQKFPGVRAETLRSIITQQYSCSVKKTYRSQTSESKRKEYCDSFEKNLNQTILQGNNSKKGSIIIDIAKKNRFSAALTAKIILSQRLGICCNDSDSNLIDDRSIIIF